MALVRATENVYVNDALGVKRLVAAAGDEYDPTVVPALGIITPHDSASAGLVPLDGYDDLTEAQVLELLPGMDAEQLAAVQAYERAHRARGTITRYGLTSQILDLPPPGAEDGTEPAAGAADPTDWSKASADDVDAEFSKRGLEAEGTGKDGKVVKADKVAALQADDANHS